MADCEAGVRQASSSNKPLGGLWKLIENECLTERSDATMKVKSHRFLSALHQEWQRGAVAWDEYLWAVGNDHADKAANAARKWHNYTDEHIEHVRKERAYARRVAVAMGNMLAEWPSARDLWGDLSKLPRLSKTRQPEPAYELVVEMETNAPERVRNVEWGAKHRISVVTDVDGNTLAVCKVCGCRAEKRAVGLKRECVGRPTSSHTASILKRLREGRHPVSNLPLTAREALHTA